MKSPLTSTSNWLVGEERLGSTLGQWFVFAIWILAIIFLQWFNCPYIWATDTKTHLEVVPTEIAHPEVTALTVVKKKAGKTELQGAVQKNQALDALNARLGITCKPQGKEQFPATVVVVVPGSAVAKRGIVKGDSLIGEATDTDGSLTLTMDHLGQGMRFTIKVSELSASVARAPNLVSKVSSSPCSVSALSITNLSGRAIDLKKKLYSNIVDVLENHDLGLIIDSSGSMQTTDCPGGLSRWDWCCQEARELAEAAAQASSSIDASIFNVRYQTYRHISPMQIPQIFAQNRPYGGTEPAGAVLEQCENYFNSAREKPLTIVVVTDGLPNNPTNIAQVLQQESRKIRYQGELTITILLIGEPTDDQNMRRILGLTAGSSVKNGGFVDIIPFETVNRYGVKNSLFADLKEVRLSTDPRKASRASETALGVSAADSLHGGSGGHHHGHSSHGIGSGYGGYGNP